MMRKSDHSLCLRCDKREMTNVLGSGRRKKQQLSWSCMNLPPETVHSVLLTTGCCMVHMVPFL
jgi:hypothetical protein